MNLTGRVFDRLTVVKRAEDIVYPNGRKVPQWLCECNCDEKTNIIVRQDSLLNKRCRSCGCLKRETTSKRFKKYNTYDLSGEYGIGYTQKEEEFYFDLEDYDKIKDYCWCINQDGYVFNSSSRILMHRLVTDCPQNMLVDHRVYGGFDWALFAGEFFEAIELPHEKDNWCEYLADIIEENCRFYTEYLAELIVSR